MRKFIISLFLLVAAISPLAQDSSNSKVIPGKVTKKIVIKHADPALIALLLAGKTNFYTSPNPTYPRKN